jgi:L-ribulose-5-phosphate 3-epimerase UlaE
MVYLDFGTVIWYQQNVSTQIARIPNTHVKHTQVVIGLQTSCYKSIHKLSTSCVRWNKLLTTCNKLDG